MMWLWLAIFDIFSTTTAIKYKKYERIFEQSCALIQDWLSYHLRKFLSLWLHQLLDIRPFRSSCLPSIIHRSSCHRSTCTCPYQNASPPRKNPHSNLHYWIYIGPSHAFYHFSSPRYMNPLFTFIGCHGPLFCRSPMSLYSDLHWNSYKLLPHV